MHRMFYFERYCREAETEREDFCVCVKPLDFPDRPQLASRLMEWIEANLQLGAKKIVLYVYTGKKPEGNTMH